MKKVKPNHIIFTDNLNFVSTIVCGNYGSNPDLQHEISINQAYALLLLSFFTFFKNKPAL